MKRIVLVTNKMVSGGIEKALIELLKKLANEYDVTLYLNSLGGELFSEIPDQIKIKQTCMQNDLISLISTENNYLRKLNILVKYFILKFVKEFANQCKILCDIYPKDNSIYDIAIAYSAPVSLANYFVLNNIFASKKVMFIHNDVSQISISPMVSKDIYPSFDYIFAVSDYAKDKFISFFPNLEKKVYVFKNLINRDLIIKLSQEKISKSQDFTICTVGRLELEKGQQIIPKVIKLLSMDGLNVIWLLVGDGSIKEDIKKTAERYGVINNIKFCGYQSNPYKYIAGCDIYVQTSQQEGYGITIAEAKLLNKPIITTNFPCANEHIIDCYNGIIVKNDAYSIAKAIYELAKNYDLRKLLISNLSNENYEKYDEYEKFINILKI